MATRFVNYRRNWLLIIPAMLFPLLAAVSAQGQIQITQCGTQITESGDYILANDLLDCPGSGIVISASNVTVHLDGRSVTGSGGGNSIGINVAADDCSFSLTGSGSISNFERGISLDCATSDFHIYNVSVTRTSIGVDVIRGRGSVTGNTVTQSGLGFVLESAAHDSSVTNNRAANNTGDGIVIRGHHNTIAFNTVRDNGEYGVVGGSDVFNDIHRNTATGNAIYDLFQEGDECSNLWLANTFNTKNLSCVH